MKERGKAKKQLGEFSEEEAKRRKQLQEIQDITKRMGHSGVEGLAGSLLRNREEVENLMKRVDSLRRHKEEEEAAEDVMTRDHEVKKAQLQAQVDLLLKTMAEERDRFESENESAKEEGSQGVTRLVESMEREKRNQEANHQREAEELQRRLDEVFERLKKENDVKLTQKVSQLDMQLNTVMKQQREQKSRSDSRLREVQKAEMDLHAQLVQLRQQQEEIRDELTKVREEGTPTSRTGALKSQLTKAMHEKEDLIRKINECNARREDFISESKEERMHQREEAEAAAADAQRHHTQLGKVQRQLQQREAECGGGHKAALELLSVLDSGVAPSHWTVRDLRDRVESCHTFRRNFITVKPFQPHLTEGESSPPGVATLTTRSRSQTRDVADTGHYTAHMTAADSHDLMIERTPAPAVECSPQRYRQSDSQRKKTSARAGYRSGGQSAPTKKVKSPGQRGGAF